LTIWCSSIVDGAPVNDDYLQRENKRVLKQAGLPYINEHKLRTTFATLVLARLGLGPDGKDWRVKRYLGHKQKGTTHRVL
jgi:integrase